MFRGVWVLSWKVKLGTALSAHVAYFQIDRLDSYTPLQKLLLIYIPVLSSALVQNCPNVFNN